MFTVWGKRLGRNCEGTTRRDFLRVGALGTTALTLPALLKQRAQAATEARSSASDTSVVWLWLGGGPTHIETFDPKMNAPAEFRSSVGSIDTAVSGVQFGGLLPEMSRVANHMSVFRSFAHTNSGHSGGTHYVMTGYDYPPADQGKEPIKPSYGSILSKARGANNTHTGVPTYVRIDGTYGDGPAWLGAGCAPFDSGGQARNNMNMSVDLDRLSHRRTLLGDLDKINRNMDRSGTMDGLDAFESQAFNLILSKAKDAFDLTKENEAVRSRYGSGLGEKLLMARRLCQAGVGFVTIHHGGWDMHGNIVGELNNRCPELDRSVSNFIADTVASGLDKKILLVITGEFGRTPRINGGAGRDHWAPLSTLALAGGGLRMGQVIGESSDKAEVPKNRPVGPQDLMATLFHVLGLPEDLHYDDQSGRPTPMINGGRVINELV